MLILKVYQSALISQSMSHNMQVGMGRMLVSGSLDSLMVRTLAPVCKKGGFENLL